MVEQPRMADNGRDSRLKAPPGAANTHSSPSSRALALADPTVSTNTTEQTSRRYEAAAKQKSMVP